MHGCRQQIADENSMNIKTSALKQLVDHCSKTLILYLITIMPSMLYKHVYMLMQKHEL